MTPITTLQNWIGSKIGFSETSYTRMDLELYQLENLQRTIQYARNRSPFYKQLFSHSPEIPQCLKDLTLYPFTFSKDITADPGRFVCVSQDAIQRIVTLPTMGTTGPSKRVFFTADDQELTIDFFQVGMANLARPGDKVLILLPGERPGSVGDLLAIGLKRLGCIPYQYGPVDGEQKLLEYIQMIGINVLVGAPVHIYRLACWDEYLHILIPGQIRSVLTSTDYLPRIVNTNIQRIWGCEIFDHYGMTESGLGGGVECAAHQGYHLREADLLYEIVNPVTGLPETDGSYGEVVLTTLTRTGMPLIRYRTEDISRFIPGNCSCGSFIKRLEQIKTRIHTSVYLNSKPIDQSELDEALFRIDGLSDFSAVFEDDSLSLNLRLVNGTIEGVRKAVLSALSNVPTLQPEMGAGKIQVVLTRVEDNPHFETGSIAKRRIMDKRILFQHR